MGLKTDVMVSLLRLTVDSSTNREAVVVDSKAPESVVRELLAEFQRNGLVEYDGKRIELGSNQRLKLAVHAINHGKDIEKVCMALDWREFENFAATAFRANNFAVKRGFRFKTAGRRWEIDLLAYSEPTIVCVDCKRWRRGWRNSAIAKVADTQAQRTEVLAKNPHAIQLQVDLGNWRQATLVPVVLSLFPGPVKFYGRVPVVPILQLQNFLDEFQGHLSELAHFRAELGPKLSEYLDGGR